jgi:hypothetical protein
MQFAKKPLPDKRPQQAFSYGGGPRANPKSAALENEELLYLIMTNLGLL